jgi:diguanylate cyclase (GGDEF)-like protein
MPRPILLLVDDEPNVLAALQRAMAALPIEIHRCGNGGDAIGFLRDADPHLIISDYRMPDMNGVSLFERVRALRPLAHRVLLTGFADLQTVMDSVNKGSVHRLLTKPWDNEELLRAARAEIMGSILERLDRVIPGAFSELFASAKEADILSRVGRLSDAIGFAKIQICRPETGDAVRDDKATPALEREQWFETLFPEAADRGRADAAAGLVLEAVRVALDRQSLMRQLSWLSEFDSLSGVLNRRGLDSALCREVERSERYGSSLCVVLLDLDHFKEINDTHGHAAGDAVISFIGKFLADSIRSTDVAGRYGGDEFCLLLPGVRVAQAADMTRRIRSSVAQWGAEDEKTRGLTVSIGIAEYGDGGTTSDELIANADRALYFVKNNGRGRTAWYDRDAHMCP